MRLANVLLCCLAVALGAASTEARAGVITGTFAYVGDSDFDLTALGAADWAYWNTTSNLATGGPKTNWKSGGTLISTISPVGGGDVRGSSAASRPTYDFTFTDGTSPVSGTVDNVIGMFNTQLNTVGAGVALGVTLPTTDEYIVYVWAAAYVADEGTLTATLPGATNFVNTQLSEPGMTKRSVLYTLRATPDNAGDTLGVSLVLSDSAGANAHVLVSGVATAIAPPPPTYYAYDGFSYPTGNLSGQNGGTGWATAWTAGSGAQVVAPTTPLQYAIPGGSLIDGGASALQISGNASPVASRALGATWSQDDVYASMLLRWDGGTPAGTDQNDFLVLRFGGSGGPQFGVKMNTGTTPDGFMVRMGETGANEGYAGLVPVPGDTYFLVAHLGKGADPTDPNDYDFLDLWISPGYGDSGSPLAHVIDAMGSFTSFSLFDIRTANFETSGSIDRILVDELRLAPTWDEAMNYVYIPEPATMFLLAGGLLALARRRRKT
ncbi:MAG TPA: PEP-CTERM sorting domain-containing protein [Planctomycetota bacterium]|nr:PEP-CTERM sorting domain-containing protein [Planctomycetota bacterium]